MKIENKEKMLHFRATQTERDEIQRQAKKLGLRLSSYVRMCVMLDLERRIGQVSCGGQITSEGAALLEGANEHTKAKRN